jgi:ubiquinone/menaquinone biosynthesis C-methylase UbiE
MLEAAVSCFPIVLNHEREKTTERESVINPNPTPESQASAYVMGRTSEEYERLRRQAELLEPITASVFARAGLCTGMCCLDVGCGPGEVMRLMAERVGPTGKIVGIDVDGMLGREGLSALVSKGYLQCAFIEGDLGTLEQIGSDPFDLVFARFLLMHLDDPILALRKMYCWVKPGGRIVVQDYYFPSIDSYPSVEPLDEFKKVFFGVYNHTRRETRMGLKLPGYFIEAGIGTPDGTDVSGHLLSMQVGARMLAAVYRSVLPLALKYGVTTEQRSASFFEEIRKSESDSSYFLWPLLVSAWRQKPAQSH